MLTKNPAKHKAIIFFYSQFSVMFKYSDSAQSTNAQICINFHNRNLNTG